MTVFFTSVMERSSGGCATATARAYVVRNRPARPTGRRRSGNSANVLLALKTARERGAVTMGLTGDRGGKMRPLCDICAVVPCANVQMIEDLHHAMLHSIFTVVRDELRSHRPMALSASAGRLRK